MATQPEVNRELALRYYEDALALYHQASEPVRDYWFGRIDAVEILLRECNIATAEQIADIKRRIQRA